MMILIIFWINYRPNYEKGIILEGDTNTDLHDREMGQAESTKFLGAYVYINICDGMNIFRMYQRK